MQIMINTGGKRHKAAFLSTPHTNAIDWENAHASVVITEACATLGLKKTELANLMGVTYPYLTVMQSGKSLMPSVARSYLAMLCWLKENQIYSL
jgi:DNA-binding Xre family transcriptional regulator